MVNIVAECSSSWIETVQALTDCPQPDVTRTVFGNGNRVELQFGTRRPIERILPGLGINADQISRDSDPDRALLIFIDRVYYVLSQTIRAKTLA